MFSLDSRIVLCCNNYYYSSGNHTPSTKPILPERVILPSGNEISIEDDWDELHDGAERGPVDRDGARRTKS